VTPVPILLYHSVAPTCAPQYRRWCISPELFEAHLDLIGELGYTCVGISDLVDGHRTGSLPSRPLAITFDDGRADFFDHALPLLAARGLPSTMYVVSGHVGRTSSWLDVEGEEDQPMMTWEQLREAAAHGVEIGAHSATHPHLDVIGKRRASEEIHRSRHELERGMGTPIRSFAYPHGYHSTRIKFTVRSAGFDSACAVRDTWSSDDDDRFALSRLIIDGETTSDELRSRLARPDTGQRRSQALLRVSWRTVRRVRHQLAGDWR
jgi:peptidoglycan/xylan/chitin deacetylase (PgdA/CDA1 family)